MSDKLTYPVSVISNLLGLSDRRVQQLAKDDVIPKSDRGRYPLVGAVRGYIEHLKSQLPNTGKPIADIREEMARLKRSQANLSEMEEREREGSLLNAERVYKEDFAFARIIRDSMMTIPDRIASALANEKSSKKIHLKLYQEIEKTISKLVDEMESKSALALEKLEQGKSEDEA